MWSTSRQSKMQLIKLGLSLRARIFGSSALWQTDYKCVLVFFVFVGGFRWYDCVHQALWAISFFIMLDFSYLWKDECFLLLNFKYKAVKTYRTKKFSVSSRTNPSKLLTWWRPPIIDNPCVFYRNRCYAVKRRIDYWKSDRKRRDDTLTVYLWTHLGVFIIVIQRL